MSQVWLFHYLIHRGKLPGTFATHYIRVEAVRVETKPHRVFQAYFPRVSLTRFQIVIEEINSICTILDLHPKRDVHSLLLLHYQDIGGKGWVDSTKARGS